MCNPDKFKDHLQSDLRLISSLNICVKDKETREKLFNAVETVPAVKRKADWAMQWTGSE